MPNYRGGISASGRKNINKVDYGFGRKNGKGADDTEYMEEEEIIEPKKKEEESHILQLLQLTYRNN